MLPKDAARSPDQWPKQCEHDKTVATDEACMHIQLAPQLFISHVERRTALADQAIPLQRLLADRFDASHRR